MEPQVRAAVVETTATFPPETARLVVPVASGAGSEAPIAADEFNWTRKYPCAGMDPMSAVVCQLVLAAEAYWTLQPPRLTADELALKSSTKSWSKLAPELPPPAKTWLTTTPEDEEGDAGAARNSVANARTTSRRRLCMGGSDREEGRVSSRGSRAKKTPKVSIGVSAHLRHTSGTPSV